MNMPDNIDVEKIDISIQMLEKYVKEAKIEPLLSALKDLKKDPNNESLLVQLSEVFGDLDITQGAVLTYAPYIGIIILNDPFDF